MVDSSYFVGYFITQVPGGFLAAKYKANMYDDSCYIKFITCMFYIIRYKIFRIFGTAIAISAALNLLVPGAARAGYVVLMILRIFQGLVEVDKLLTRVAFVIIYLFRA